MYNRLKEFVLNTLITFLLSAYFIPIITYLQGMELSSSSIQNLARHKESTRKESPRTSNRSTSPQPKPESPRTQKLNARKKYLRERFEPTIIEKDVCDTMTMYTWARDSSGLAHVAIHFIEQNEDPKKRDRYVSLSWKWQENALKMPREEDMIRYKERYPVFQLIEKEYAKQEKKIKEQREQKLREFNEEKNNTEPSTTQP